VDRLSAGLEPSQKPRRVLVVRQRDVNAIALPGGTVMVFSGLLKDARDPGELAGVLAHEFTHLRLRHPVAAMIRATGVGVAVTLITGDSSGVVATAAAVGLAGAYSREDEAAADTGGVALLRAAGLDARGMASFFRRLGEEKPGMVPVWLSTHPDSLARAEAVEALDGPAATPPLTGEQWQALKGICGAEKP
jgi:predicted Zn-dependent protease